MDAVSLTVSIIAAAISLGSATIAGFALRTARAAHALNAQRDREENRRRDAEQFEQARLVLLIYGFMGAPSVDIENRTEGTITEVVLERIECTDLTEDWRIEANMAVPGTVSSWPSIAAGEKEDFPFILINPDGVREDQVAFGQELDFQFTLAYTDAQGQRWRRTNSRDPERIER